MVRSITLNDGKKIPSLGWGNMHGEYAVDNCASALKHGILHIDTAQVYRTEPETAESIKKAGISRKDVWVTTKISDYSKTQCTPEDVRRSVTESIERLGFIPDLILLHNPFLAKEKSIAEFYGYVEDLVMDGTLKGCSLGISNFRPQDIEELLKVARIKPVVNQIEYHPYVLTHLDPVMKLHAQHNIVVQSYGPLSPLIRHPTGGPLKPVLARIAQRLARETGKEVDEASVLLLWTVQQNVVALTSSSQEKRIQQFADTEALPDLTKEEMEEIDQVGRQIHHRAYANHMVKDFPSPNLPVDVSA